MDDKSRTNRWNGKPHSQKYYEMLEKRKTLPVWQQRREFLLAFRDNQTLIVAGDTSSGKTTQIPQFVLEAVDWKLRDKCRNWMIACTQPRRGFAMSVSKRVAEEMDVCIGEEVGYSIRFEDVSSEKTILKYLRDSMLLREAMNDPLLERYKVIILDEAHDRTLATDVLFGILKGVLKKRPDLKLVVISDTLLAAKKFQGYFNGAPLMKISSRLHPVKIVYTKEPESNYLMAAIRAAVEIHRVEPPGDILVFLASEDEVKEACRWIAHAIENLGYQVGPVDVLQLYSNLPAAMQRIFGPPPLPFVEGDPHVRKIVVSTDIAETSLTIDGIVYVIDTGFVIQEVFNPRLGAHSFLTCPISKASANQRARRAVRTQQGKCFRLYTQDGFDCKLSPRNYPEILRSNLASTILTLKKVGIDDLMHFDFMDPPAPKAISRAMKSLNYLGALDDDGNLTQLGEMMCEFPLDPQMAKMVVTSPEFNCSNEILTIASMLSVPNCFKGAMESQSVACETKSIYGHIDGDHLSLLNVYHAYKQNNEEPLWCLVNYVDRRVLMDADYIRQQLVHIMERLNLKLCSTSFSSPDYYPNIRKAILAGYFMQAAHFERLGRYFTVKNHQMVYRHPMTSLDHKSEWIMYNEVLTSRMYTMTNVRGEWLVEIAPRYFDPANIPESAAKDVLERILRKKQIEREREE